MKLTTFNWIVLALFLGTCYVADGGIVSKIPKAMYKYLRELCNHIDEFKDCMVRKGSVTAEEAENLKTEIMSKNICPLPEKDEDLKALLEKYASDEKLMARLKSMSKHLKSAIECFKEVLGLQGQKLT